MQYTNGNKTFKTGTGGVGGHRLVKLDGTTVVHNTAVSTDEPIGIGLYTTEEGYNIAVKFLNSPGTVLITAADAIDQGDPVYAADNGKIQPLPANPGTYRKVGRAIKGASGDGSIIEVLPYNYFATETVS